MSKCAKNNKTPPEKSDLVYREKKEDKAEQNGKDNMDI